MIAICKHLCRGVDGKGIVRECYIHLTSFLFCGGGGGVADERDAAVFCSKPAVLLYSKTTLI